MNTWKARRLLRTLSDETKSPSDRLAALHALEDLLQSEHARIISLLVRHGSVTENERERNR